MKRECDRFEESIWEHARTGGELAKDARRHAQSCEECARALEDAKTLSGLLAEAGRVPDAPDCRSAVMARISGEARRWAVPAWAYACAVVLIGAAVAVGIVNHQPKAPATAPLVVKKISPARSGPPVIAKKNVPQPRQVAVGPTHHVTQPTEGIKSTSVRRHVKPRYRVVRRDRAVALHPTRKPRNVEPGTSGLALAPGPRPPTPDPRSVAAVYVTWPQAGDSADTSYQYVERDAQTGETTTCSVKRSGDKVEIYIESTPGGNAPPVKGSIQNESTIDA